MRLIDAVKSRENNFDVLRLFGALLVLVSHSYALSGKAEPTIAGVSFGAVGVFIFFGISGFLVTKSWVHQPRLGAFFAKRALRILPALLLVSLLTAYVIGPLVTTTSLQSYFGSPLTHAYALRNATLRTDYLLPGVFAHNAYPSAVNGSLWTLPTEARAYAGVAILGLFVTFMLGWRPRLRRPKASRRFVFIGSAVVLAIGLVAAILKASGHAPADYGVSLPSPKQVTGGFSQWYLFLEFAVGGALYLGRSRVALRWDAFAAVIAVWFAASHATMLPHSFRTEFVPALVIPYATLVLAFRGSPRWRKLTAWGDMSYGVYLWAFPVQQVIALKLGSSVTPLAMIALSLPITCLLGAASWFAVERRALRLKPGRRPAPAPPVAEPGLLTAPAAVEFPHAAVEPTVPAVAS